jgi:hypothetical protein
MDDVVNAVKAARVLCTRSSSFYNSLEEGLERVVEWGYGKGERGEWCCELASDIIDEHTEMGESEVEGIKPEVGGDGMYMFGAGMGGGGGGQQQQQQVRTEREREMGGDGANRKK